MYIGAISNQGKEDVLNARRNYGADSMGMVCHS